MKFEKLFTCFFLLIIISSAHAQEKFNLSGVIKDDQNNETIIGATVYVAATNQSAVTNEYGYYSITLPKGLHVVTYQFPFYQSIQKEILLDSNRRIDVSLSEESQALEEVVIDVNKQTNVRKAEMSVSKLSVETIKKIPVVMGEVDVFRSLLQLPGVTNAGEGASGFNVRGGGADQNLVLLDEATIYNSSHLFGFFSVFNADAIKDLKLYKGGIPSRFGGRISSVLDVHQKNGNSKEFKLNGGIGLISSRLMAEGPIVKDKGSFLIAGRASYAHLFLKLADNQNSAYFYDLNTKLSYTLNDNNSLYFSGYFGRDVFNIADNFKNNYGNTTLNLRWNHLFSDKLFSNLSLIYSDYYYGLTLDFVGFNFDLGIKNYNLKYDFKSYISDKLKISYGANALYYDFNPGKISPNRANSGINSRQFEKKYAFEPALYIDLEQDLTKNISVNYGLRYSMFYRLGASNVLNYANNQSVVFNDFLQIYEKGTPIGSTYYNQNQTIASFDHLEPRAAISFALSDNHSIKASYNRMVQYLQLISNTSSPTPLDLWTPSDAFIKPQIGDQVALGYFKNFKNDAYSLEFETYYKTVQNRIDYIDGANLIGNENIEQVLLNGEQRSYGAEILLRKNKGKLTGWIAYTLSKSQQKTPGRTALETGINNGEWYNSAYDKLHNLAVTATYELNSKWNFGANFVLQSGQPVTYPDGYFEYQGIKVPSYGKRNEDRLPAFHHLDLSATFTPSKNKTRKWQGEWVFSLYNVYGRKNAASISFRQDEISGMTESARISIFGIVPGITYNFKF